jgi:hypothetical protein
MAGVGLGWALYLLCRPDSDYGPVAVYWDHPMDTVTPEVEALLRSHVRSLDDLQVLMSCAEAPGRWWDAAGMAREAGISVTAARHALDHFVRRHLFDIRVTGDVRYSFSPATDDLREATLACAAAYRLRPLALVQAIAGAPNASVRDFADAFRIRGAREAASEQPARKLAPIPDSS